MSIVGLARCLPPRCIVHRLPLWWVDGRYIPETEDDDDGFYFCFSCDDESVHMRFSGRAVERLRQAHNVRWRRSKA